ncbi:MULTISPECIES: phage tail protein [Micromonospora]|uniref:Phage tail protein domain-containing protein n=1 Tax=Micromonospora yangpuensis TaxID=683228 RepID=A0A1C6TWC8_9ACTN|nr:phage tail protein [Micromonospora yangpuensis]GGM01291.1 tail protein [Micromonospora yangpuensis]SCL46132.1 phage tail protein domain-containing protein [Micromonospora yangpuensis]
MRAAVAGLATPDPLGRRLPAVYAADDLAQRLTGGFDQVLAPVHATLDSLWAYFDPALAPPDFVDWLGSWVAAGGGRDRPAAERRRVVAGAVARHRVRGTAAGLAEEVRLATGLVPEIVESGGTTWSVTPGTALPGSAVPALTVRVYAPEPSDALVARLRAVVEANRPAHVPYTVEVLPLVGEDPAGTDRTVAR